MSRKAKKRKFKREALKGVAGLDPRIRRVGASGALIEWGVRQYEPTLTTHSQDVPKKPEKRRQWLRYFYEFDPLFGSLIDFFADFPMVGMHNEHPDDEVVKLYDDLCSEIDMDTYLSDIFFEYYLVSDVFPFIYFEPDSGHIRESTLLNPDDIIVQRTIFSEMEMLYIKPDQGLKTLVQTRKPVELYKRLSEEQIRAIKTGKNILLNPKQAAHLKRGGSRYGLLGMPLGHRIFKSIIQRDKLKEAQWVMADRFTTPVRVFSLIGSDENPAGPDDVDSFSRMLLEVNDDPALAAITNYKVEIEMVGAEGKFAHIYNDIDYVMQEYLIGFGVTQAVVTGEGVAYSNATVGLDRLIRQFKAAHRRVRRFIEKHIYEHYGEQIEAKEPAKFKWNQVLGGEQMRQKLMRELYDIQALSLQSLHDTYGVDHETEMARLEEEKKLFRLGPPPEGGDGKVPEEERVLEEGRENGKPPVSEQVFNLEVETPQGEGEELTRKRPKPTPAVG